jgi:metal-responsive CopG/Arc/MetJ family transcriptional regulator
MSSRPVQISIDADLLRRIDKDPEARSKGRSAFVRSAVLLYLDAKRRKDTDQQIRQAFSTEADSLLEEIEPLIGAQKWPES